jgi:hypothetical protein
LTPIHPLAHAHHTMSPRSCIADRYAKIGDRLGPRFAESKRKIAKHAPACVHHKTPSLLDSRPPSA